MVPCSTGLSISVISETHNVQGHHVNSERQTQRLFSQPLGPAQVFPKLWITQELQLKVFQQMWITCFNSRLWGVTTLCYISDPRQICDMLLNIDIGQSIFSNGSIKRTKKRGLSNIALSNFDELSPLAR